MKNSRISWLLAVVLLQFGHLALADTPAGYSVLETITYEYDAEGNRIMRGATVSGVTETPIEAQYDQGNRLTQVTLNGQGQNGADTTCALAYDLNGNLATKTCTDAGGSTSVTTQYTWDSRNRLTQIQSPSVTAGFQYDPLDRRVERTVNGVTTHYLYDGSQAIAELSETGNTSYLTGLAIDEVIARYTTQGERTLLTDALGSVLIASKEDATVATAYGYSPYGETQLMGADEQNPVQYTSRENDEMGLYYYRARYYDPELKRFISEDPIGIDGGINVYAYVQGRPLDLTDPTGLVAGVDDLVIIGGAIIIGAAAMSTPQGQEAMGNAIGAAIEAVKEACPCFNYKNVYEPNSGKHGASTRSGPRGNISPEPINGPGALSTSVPAGNSRIGYDAVTGQIIIFRNHRTDEGTCTKYWHGYVVGQRDITPDQWRAGRNAGFPNWPRKPQ